ncbi:unnamed protein product, partial [Leptidea sinapis]
MKKVVLFKSTSEDYRKELCEKLKLADYHGIILTSPRAVEAISKCWSPSKYNIWNSKRIYTVGEASGHKIKLMLGLESLGLETGNAENLAKLITSENPVPSKFLFPCGNLRSELSNLPHFAIGNSTAHKIENLGVEIAGVASRPRADTLIETVRDYFTSLDKS